MSLGELWAHTNLKGLWHLETTDGTDSSGNSHTGTETAVTHSQANGKFNLGGGFNGSTSKIVIGDHADLKPTGAFTIGAWIKTNTNATQAFFQSYNYDTSKHYGIRMSVVVTTKVATLLVGVGGSGEHTGYETVTSSTVVIDNKWHFVVVTWDGTNLKIYVDGNLSGTTAWATTPVYFATNLVRVGVLSYGATNENWFNGSIDEVFLINGTAWTASQIRRWYALSVGKLQ